MKTFNNEYIQPITLEEYTAGFDSETWAYNLMMIRQLEQYIQLTTRTKLIGGNAFTNEDSTDNK